MSEKTVTQPVRFIVPGYVYRKFKFSERIRILLGCPIVLELYVACQHNPGRTHPVSEVHVSSFKDERRAIQAVQEEAVRKNRQRATLENEQPN